MQALRDRDDRPKHKIPLRITDTTLRDAHQSLWATRMRTDDILGIIDTIDSVGYYSLEVWGGATFDVCLRFLRENPWERLRQIKARAKKTPLQMLLRGQNILGYKNYPDDLLEHFIAIACKSGVDIFRIFDALNDTRNLERAIEYVKKYGGHAQGTLSYTISPVHTVQEFVRAAKEQVRLGIDSLCIKDMAGILSPIAAERLVSAIVKEIDVPIQLHCHATSGMATSSYVEGVRAGAGAIDCAISSMAGFQSQPPVETMLTIFEEMPYHATLDWDALREVAKYMLALKKRRMLSHHMPECIIDPDILVHHIPGGMISNLRSQLEQQGALDKLEEVLDEVPRVREDLGYPPLVTPTSQIIGIQAVMNVLAGERYKMVPQEVKDYVKGLYGRSPGSINSRIRRKILGNERPTSCRPADLLKPVLPTATEGVDPSLILNEEDIISYCLFPEPALDYFKWRKLPPSERPPTPADLELKAEEDTSPRQSPPPPPKPVLPADDYNRLQELLEKIHELDFTELSIRRKDLSFTLRGKGVTYVRAEEEAQPSPVEAQSEIPQPPPKPEPAGEPRKTEDAPGTTLNSPLAGTFYSSPALGKPPFVQAGDAVKEGTTVCTIEAMKLFNDVKAAEDCKILDVLVKHGAAVEKNQPLMRIEKVDP